MRERRVVYELPGMDRAQVRRDVTYRTVEGVALQCDVYLPPRASGALPAVLFVHGGGFDWPALMPVQANVKSWGQYVSYGELCAASGLAAVTFNHRSQTAADGGRGAAEDIESLIDFVREHAGELGIDGERLCVWSISAGVPYGVTAARSGERPYVRCLVVYYGPLDLRPLAPQYPDARDALEAYSPIARVRADWPPMLIARAGRDRAMGMLIKESIDAFVAEARGRGARVELLEHPGDHAFDVSDASARTREVIERTLGFVREGLAG